MRAAYACAPASTARQSLPVAMTTASMPFMMPLLWVAARYGSSSAKRDALRMPSMTSVPLIVVGRERLGRDAAAHAHAALVAEVRQDAQADAAAGDGGERSATASATELTRLAPMASWQSTMTWTTIMVVAEHARLDAARAAAARDQAAHRPVGESERSPPRAPRCARPRRAASLHVAELRPARS